MGAQQRSHPRLEDARRPRSIGALVQETANRTYAGASFACHRIESGSHTRNRRETPAYSAVEGARHDPNPCDRTEIDERPLDDGARNADDRGDPSPIQICDAVHNDAGRHGRMRSGDGDLDEACVVDESKQCRG